MTTPTATISAWFLPILDRFRSRGAFEVSLEGVHIEPAPNIGGVVMIATNGHRLLVAHDEEGEASDRQTWALPQNVIDACALPVDLYCRCPCDACTHCDGKQEALPAHRVSVADDLATVYSALGRSDVLAYGKAERIEGKFPDWTRVIPHPDHWATKPWRPLATHYVADFTLPGSRKSSVVMHDLCADMNSPVGFSYPKHPELFGVLMPVEIEEEQAAAPEWLKKSLGAPPTTGDTHA